MSNELVKAATKPGFMSKVKLGWSRHGATITFVAGVAGAIGAGVMGAFGALKAKKIIDQQDAEKTRINEQIGKPMMINGEETTYTEEDAAHDLKIVKRDTVVGVAKAVGPAVGLGLASVGMLTYSHVNNMGKIAGMTAYASALEQQVQRGRELLANEVGEENADMLMAGYHKEKKVTEKVDEETGEVTETVEEVLVRDLDVPANGVFTFTFRKGWWEWSANRDRNLSIVKLRMRELQTTLDKNGAATLDNMMDIFEVPQEDRHGWDHVCGWIWEPGKVLDYEIMPATSYDDYDITFIIRTDGVILKKIDDARKEYERRIGTMM